MPSNRTPKTGGSMLRLGCPGCPLIPAQTGIQNHSQSSILALDSRLRGNERVLAVIDEWDDLTVAPFDQALCARSLVRRIFHVRDRFELDVDDVVADLFDPADVDVLNYVAGCRIDRDRAARALPLHPLGGCDEGIAVGLAAGLLERLINEVHAVIAADREAVGVTLVFGVEGIH